MKKLLSCTLAAILATTVLSIASPNDAALEAKEKAAWQAFKDKDAEGFKKCVSADMVAVYADGIYDLQKELDSMNKTDMKSFDLTGFKVVMTDDNTAMVTYNAKVTEGDKTTDYNCGSVWQMKNGEWRAIFHTDAQKKE
jgi:hypothetical protein